MEFRPAVSEDHNKEDAHGLKCNLIFSRETSAAMCCGSACQSLSFSYFGRWVIILKRYKCGGYECCEDMTFISHR